MQHRRLQLEAKTSFFLCGIFAFGAMTGGMTFWIHFISADSVSPVLTRPLDSASRQDRAMPVHISSRHEDWHLSQKLSQTSSIPRIIHQSWRSTKLEKFQTEWQKTWLTNHPDWTYMFWTDKENRRLIADHFPWFLDVYDSFPLNIQRADCARYFYMLQFGGCYFDLDFESLKNLDPLLLDVQVALAYMTTDIAHEISIPNAFVASVPGHAFWWYVLKHVLMAVASDEIGKGDAHRTTGPIMLKNAVAQYHKMSPLQDLTIFSSQMLIGVDFNWRDDPKMLSTFLSCHAASEEFNSTKCKLFFPESYSITYWSGDLTWMAG